MEQNDLQTENYKAVQDEKRDRINARLQIWQLVVALVSGFGLASLQAGNISYVVALYPLLACCVARYAGHSELVLDQIKAFLLEAEEKDDVLGYERFNLYHPFKSASGGHKKALRDALVLTEALATLVVIVRLCADGLQLQAGIVVMVECIAIGQTIWYLREVSRG